MALARALLLLVVPRDGALKAALSAEMIQFRRLPSGLRACRRVIDIHRAGDRIVCAARSGEKGERGGFVAPV